MSCRLKKTTDGSGFTPESLKPLTEILVNGEQEAIMMSNQGENIPLLALGIERMLNKIGDTYHNQDLDKILPIVLNFLTGSGLIAYVPGKESGLYNLMSKKNRRVLNSTRSGLEQYTGTGTLEEIKETNRQFLDRTFGQLADIKNKVRQQAAHIMINTFIINREESYLIKNIGEVNSNARKQKQKLFKTVIEYLQSKKYTDLPQDLFVDDNYTYALQEDSFKRAISLLDALLFTENSPEKIESLYSQSHSSEDAKKEYDAAIAWFTLKNFDNFVDTLIGSAFTINPDHRGKIVNDDMYSYSDKGHHLITSWTTSDETVLETRISKLVLTLIDSTPFTPYGTNTKNGEYIKFEDFYKIITKIKDLALEIETSNITINPSDKIYAELKKILSPKDLDLIKNKSLRWIINNIRTNPQKFLRIAMQVINTKSVMDRLGNFFTKEEKDKCWSLYKGIFDPTHSESINYILNQNDYRAVNYYSSITQTADAIFSIVHLLYNDEDGVISIRSLRDLSSDNIRRELESSILRSNTRRRNYDFDKNELSPYGVKPVNIQTLGNESLTGISCEIKLASGESFLIEITKLGAPGGFSYKLNGRSIVKSEDIKNILESNPEIYNFIAKQLKIDFNLDKEFKNNYYEIAGSDAAKELLELASVVLLNKYISNVVLKDVKGPTETKKRLNEIYGNSLSKPGYDGSYNEMKLVPDNRLPILERLARAKAVTTGEAQTVTVKDADGNSTSTQSLSRLLGALTSQFELLRDYFDESANRAAVSHFSILKPGFYKGFANIKELKSPSGNKLHTQFTVAEYIQGGFLQTFVRGFMNFPDYSGKSVIGNGKIGILPSVNSDKNTIGIGIFDLNDYIPNSTTIRWRDLDYKTISDITRKELGEYYVKQQAAIDNTYKKLSAFSEVEIDNNNNFLRFNELCKEEGISAQDKLYEITLLYNQQNPLNPIKLIDQIHYIKDGNGVKENNTIKSLSDRYHNETRYNEFMKLKELDLLQALVDENVSINLYDSFEQETPGKWLQTNYPQWIGKSGHNNGNMTLAKITVDGVTYDITSKVDLLHVAEIHKFDITKNLHALRNISVELHPMLQKWNAFDYLLSLEFLLSSVGSHVTHPTKVKTKPPVIWKKSNNPTVSRDALLRDPEYRVALSKLLNKDLVLDVFSNPDEGLVVEVKDTTSLHKAVIYYSSKKKRWKADVTTPDSLGNVIYLSPEQEQNLIDKHIPKDLLEYFTSGEAMESDRKLIEYIDSQDPDFNKTIAERIEIGAISGIGAAEQIRDRWGIYFFNEGVEPTYINIPILIENSLDDIQIISENSNRFIIVSERIDDLNESELKEVWEDYVKIAERENKILITSSERVKQLAENTIDHIIESDNDMFILNNALEEVLDNEIKEEASRFLALHKRNVSLTAAMHPFLLNLIDGIPTEYNMAVIDDITFDLYTIMGNTARHLPFDGATFVNPLVVYWENNSLREDRAGIDKKQFIHYYDEVTGTGGIIKTAGFGLTNDRIKNYEFYRTMAYNMMKRSWINPDGTPHVVLEGGILKDFMGNDVNYGPIYFKKGSKYYMREIVKYNNDNTYTVIDSEVDEQGDVIKVGSELLFEFNGDTIVNSNYDVWLLFGGWNSMELGENGTLVPSENSLKLTAQAANTYGYRKNPGLPVEDASDIVLPMKLSDIHYMPTVGAIKQGAANINPKSRYFEKKALNHMRVKMRQGGIQLDKEHHANGSVLSLMTQVISAAAAKGYTITNSSGVYQALYNITKLGTKDFRDLLGNITSDPEQFDAAVSHIILQTILNSSPTDGNLILNIAHDLIKEFRSNKNIKLNKEFSDKIDNQTPYSSRAIYKKLITALTSSLTKAGIKQDISGILAVLNPTQDIIKLFKVPVLDSEGNIIPDKYKTCKFGLLEDYFELYGVNNERDLLLKIQEELPPIYEVAEYNEDSTVPTKEQTGSISNIDIGKYYIIQRGTEEEVVYVSMPNSTKNEKGEYPTKISSKNEKIPMYGYIDIKNDPTITGIKEYLLEGNDLKSYNVRFDGIAESDTNLKPKSFQLADLDIILDFFNIKSVKGQKQYNLIFDTLRKYNKLEALRQFIERDVEKTWRIKLEKAKTEKNNFLQQKAERILSFIQQFKDNPYSIYNEKYPENSEAQLFQSYVINSAQKVLHRELQLHLNALSNSDSKVKYVYINNEKVFINKASIKILNYGAIMPKTFMTELGLELFDDLETIKNDPDFFVKRLAQKFATKVHNYLDYDEDGNEYEVYNFHLELKRTNGRHVYIRQGLKGAKLGEEINIHIYTDAEGNVFRRDSDGNILHPLSSANDKVYLDARGNEIIVTAEDSETWKDSEGNNVAIIKNGNGTLTTTEGHTVIHVKGNTYYDEVAEVEITRVETSGLLFYLDNLEYNSLYINNAVSDTEFTTILGRAASSRNTVANNIASKILRLGSKEKNLTDSIKKQRELSDLLGDYESLLNLDPDGLQRGFYNFAKNHITRLGRRMHTSFLKTLTIVAARIPAQNQQSFMAMEIEAYDNPDINSAYVSTYQFFLQGSDLDIDAVSLQTFTLNNSGLYVGHSPYYNLDSMELAKASEVLPFPTGEKVTLEDISNPNTEQSTFEKYIEEIEIENFDSSAEEALIEAIFGKSPKGLFNIFKKKNGDVVLSLNLDSEDNIIKFAQLLREPRVLKAGTAFLDKINKRTDDDIQFTEELVESLNEQLVNILNKHHLYIDKSNVKKRTNIQRNWLTRLLVEIIQDPINQLEAMSPIDEVTSDVKNLAKKSSKATVQDTFTPANVVNKYQSISENMVGKDGIAVCATDLKVFFALTQMHNTIMGEGNVKEKEDLLFEITIGGKTYNGLANVFTNRFFTGEEEYGTLSYGESLAQDLMFSDKIKDYLIEQLIASDVSNDKSAFLSLSADNAKELVLAKINAGTATIGMYLYGLSMGVPVDTLYKIMTSDLGKRLAELTKGNSFNGETGSLDIIGTLDYIMREPYSYIYKFTLNLSNYKGLQQPSLIILGNEELRKYIKEHCTTNGKIDTEKVYTHFNALRKNCNEPINAIKNSRIETRFQDAINYEIQYNRFIDFAIQYANDMKLAESTFYETVYGGGNVLTDFETLAMGAHELKLIGKLLRLNQEIKTDPQELLEQVANIENALVKRATLIRRYNRRHSKPYKPAKLETVEDENFYAEIIESKGSDYKSKYKIDFEKFIKDRAYAKECIHQYDVIKASYNPLKVLYEVVHYKGYAETLYMAYQGYKNKSSKFRFIVEKKSEIEQVYNIYDSGLKELLGKNIENLIDVFYRQSWMLSRYKPITIPGSTDTTTVYAFSSNFKEAMPIYSPREIQLGTNIGDANYKLWMEEIVIPELKKRFPNNKFILGLKFTVNPKTAAGTIATSMSLPINLLPKSEYERDLFSEYKKSFNDLSLEKNTLYKDAKGIEYPVQELLFLYSLITTNGRISQTSLHGIFEDYMLSEPAKSFNASISEIDKDADSSAKLNEMFDIDDVIPFSTRYRGGSDRFREFDKETEEIVVWERPDFEGMDPNELNDDPGYVPEFVKANTRIATGFNTDYFLSGAKTTDTGLLIIDETRHPELAKYDIVLEDLMNGKSRVVSITAKNPEDLKKVDMYLYDTYKGKLPQRIYIDTDGVKRTTTDLDILNDGLKDAECLSV